MMNEANYRELRGYLEGLAPEKFDYNSPCMCVGGHVQKKLGEEGDGLPGPGHIRRFLECASDESRYIFGAPMPWDGRTIEAFLHYEDGTEVFDGRGADGIAEAIRRLDVVAARHGVRPEATSPDDNSARFLERLRAEFAAPAKTEPPSDEVWFFGGTA